MLIETIPHDHHLELRLDREPKRNALSHELVDDLIAGLQSAQAPVVVLGANGPVFCAGGDRADAGTDPVPSARLLSHLRTTETFVVGRVEGAVLGAGVAVVASCPVTVGGPGATFALPEARMGNLPVPLPYLEVGLGRRQALAAALSGAAVTAEEAVAGGLLTALVSDDEIDAAVERWVELLLAEPLVASQARRRWQRHLAAVATAADELEATVRAEHPAPTDAT